MRTGKIIDILIVTMSLWFICSWAEITLKNLDSPADYSPANMFHIFFREEEPAAPEPEPQTSLTSFWAELTNKSGNTIQFRTTNGMTVAANVFDPSLFDENGFYSIYLDEHGEVIKIFKEVW